MAPGYGFQVFLRVAVQNQIRIAQWVIRRQRSSSLLFKSSYPLLLLKRNCRIKQKRQLSKAVSLVVRVVIQNFSKTIVVQFVFEAIG